VLSVTVLGLGRSPLRPRTYASVNGSRALTTGAARPSNINLYILARSLTTVLDQQRVVAISTTSDSNSGTQQHSWTAITISIIIIVNINIIVSVI